MWDVEHVFYVEDFRSKVYCGGVSVKNGQS